jgi:hypothetical protein
MRVNFIRWLRAYTVQCLIYTVPRHALSKRIEVIVVLLQLLK